MDLKYLDREDKNLREGGVSEYAVFLKKSGEDSFSADSEIDSGETSNNEDEKMKCDDGPKFDGNIPEGMDPKEWTKKVKEANRERRKTKTPKHVKKARSKKKH